MGRYNRSINETKHTSLFDKKSFVNEVKKEILQECFSSIFSENSRIQQESHDKDLKIMKQNYRLQKQKKKNLYLIEKLNQKNIVKTKI